jgi:hypothetical protein
MIEGEIKYFLPESNKESINEKKSVLVCNSCLKKLVEIIEVLDIKVEQSIKATCSCGGSSFLLKTQGKTFTIPLDGSIVSIEYPFDSSYTVIKCK